ncbi:MAG TPA: SCP2 sterol-binding domain-containing protein [Gaiellaceae bacterium]|nr:SCP2 sterol-binding domain-containing protein [Gaiellaceae bacterium]
MSVAREFFETLPGRASPEQIDGVDRGYLFDIAGEGRWLVEVRGGTVTVTENPDLEGDVEFSMTGETFQRIDARKLNPMVAYMTGKLKVKGDIGAAMELRNLLS